VVEAAGALYVADVKSFALAICWPGAESAIKADVARRRRDLRLAFSRPGLLTFKSEVVISPDDEPPSPFARVWGRSVGAAADGSEACALVAGLGLKVPRVQVFSRGASTPEDVDRHRAEALVVDRWRNDLTQAGSSAALRLQLDGPAALGELVVDCVVAAEEPAWLGLHRYVAGGSPWPGGGLPVAVPEAAPSRAYAKIEEAIAWAGLDVRVGDMALEIGAAPGGAALALVQRGVSVLGVDTAPIVPAVLAYRHASGARVEQRTTTARGLRFDELPARVDWLLVDVNLAPKVALGEVSRLMPALRPTLRGAVFTLKMNDWKLAAALDELSERIAAMGLPRVTLRHLASNRREICAVARPP